MTGIITKAAICDVYDRSNYAETYDSHFLTSQINRGHNEFETEVIELVSPYFEQCEIVTYPALTVDGLWNRKALLCRGRR